MSTTLIAGGVHVNRAVAGFDRFDTSDAAGWFFNEELVIACNPARQL